ncbi:hypothetical protein PENSPDRAFT_458964 [Peniophora sp. CONT]|nr:hypothetical protein PENSPDRAFT_458964 [Peniophora sp. CONT]
MGAGVLGRRRRVAVPESDWTGGVTLRASSFLVFRDDDELGQTVTLLTDKSVAARDLKTSNGRLCSVPSFESALLKKQAKLDRTLTLKFTLSSLGAIGLMFAFSWATDAARVEPRSVLVACLLVFFVFFLAYLSNPSEASFRSYLTEQSFRHHLSRLDDPKHDQENKDQDDCSPASLEQGGSAVHFSSRAAVALRTPKHAFHSFAFFTIAAVLPGGQPKAALGAVHTAAETKEAWFVGAFGRWWKGGYVDPSWPAPAPRKGKASANDDDAWSSGIMTVKALDKLDKHDGLPLPASSAARNARNPPKLRSRDRSKPRNGHTTPRSSTPPPLPKSVTLPLHTPRRSSNNGTAQGQGQTLTVPSPHHNGHGPTQQHSNPAQTLKEKEAEYANAPVVKDLLSRIKTVQSTNSDLRGQIADHASQSAEVGRGLGEELARAREEKRVEDVARAEAKSRTKSLEEARRAAEAARRDAERRLAGARKVIEDARAVVGAKQNEIKGFKEKVEGDKMRKVKRAQREAKVAEDVVGALGVRARELEEAIAAEVVKLEKARERARLVQLERPQGWIERQMAQHAHQAIEDEPMDVFPTPLEKDSDARSRSSGSGSRSTGSREVSASPGPRPSPLNLRAISNIPERDRGKGYAIFDDDIAGLGLGLGIPGLPGYAGHNGLSAHASHAPGVPHPHISGHPPLQTPAIDIPQQAQKDSLNAGSPASIDMSSPTAAGLIPGSLIRSLERGEPEPDSDTDIGMSASFTSDGDAILGRDWRPVQPSAVGAPVGEFGQVGMHRPVSHAGSVGSMHSLVANSRAGSLNHPLSSIPAFTSVPTPPSTAPIGSAPFAATPSATSTVFGSGSAPTTASYASTLASSPVSAKFPLPEDGDLSVDFDPFTRSTVSLDVQPAPRRSIEGAMQRPPWTPPRTPDVPQPVPVEGKRRWWGKDKEQHKVEKDAHKEKDKDKAPVKKGLNPDAKVFRFGRKSAPAATLAPPPSVIGSPARSPHMHHTLAHQHQPFDSLNPSGFPSPLRAGMGGFLSNLSLRAFAPSPAEREALKRALGGNGSASASLERLPSLGGGLGSSGLDRIDGSLERLVGKERERDEVFEMPGRITFSPWGESEGE